MARTNLTIEELEPIMIVTETENVLNSELQARYHALAKIISGEDKCNHSVTDIVGYYISTICWRLDELGQKEVVGKWKDMYKSHVEYMKSNKMDISTYSNM